MKCTRRLVALLFVFALAVASADELDPETVPEEVPTFQPTKIKAPFIEQFTADWEKRWARSNAIKQGEEGKEDKEEFRYDGTWAVEEATAYPGIKGDNGLVLKDKAKHHAISAPFDEPLDNTGKTLVVQYEVKLQSGLECGGAYLKLLTDSGKAFHGEEFMEKTPYTIMFGPDRCGTGTNKVHFIFRHKNLKTGEYEEKHMDSAPSVKITKLSTLYTLIVRPDNSFDLRINNDSALTGSLLSSFTPSVNPDEEIDDPDDTKPTDWVDDPKIPDPDAKKPDDWDEDAPAEILDEEAEKPADWLEDEPLVIPDADAKPPEGWDSEMDGDWTPPDISNPKCEAASGCGEWKRPMKRNPAYKGKWYPPMIDNPNYKGPWAPRKILNPNYFEDKTPSNFERIAAVGFELWTMTQDILFDNIYIGHSEEDAQAFAEETWAVKYKIEKAAEDATLVVDPPESALSFTEDPVTYLQTEVAKFFEIFFVSPLDGVQEKPLIAGFLVFVIVTFFGLFGLMFSLASPKKPKVVPHKKNDEPTPDDKSDDEASGSKDPGNDGDNEEEKTSAGPSKRRKPKKET